MLLKLLRVALEYGMLFCLLLFFVRVYKAIFKEAHQELRKLNKKVTKASEAILTVVEATEADLSGRRFAFSEKIRIGRGADNDIVIPEGFVSHYHAMIFAHGNQYVIEDLGSVNSTLLNDKELAGKAYIKNGDLVRIGMVTMRFER